VYRAPHARECCAAPSELVNFATRHRGPQRPDNVRHSLACGAKFCGPMFGRTCLNLCLPITLILTVISSLVPYCWLKTRKKTHTLQSCVSSSFYCFTLTTTCAFRRPRSHILRQNISFADVCSRDVCHTPVMPLTELRISATWSIRVCNVKRTNDGLWQTAASWSQQQQRQTHKRWIVTDRC